MFPGLEVLSQQEIQDIHTASVEILNSVGIEFRHAEVLELLRKEGARVEGTRVCFPRELINQALKTAPEGFRLEARNPERSVWIGVNGNDGQGSIFAPPAGCVYIQDFEGARRRAQRQDYLNLVRIIEQSPHFGVNGGGIVMPDIPGLSDRENFAWLTLAAHWYSDKPQMGLTVTGDISRNSLAISEIVFRGRPGCHLLGTINPDSPLIYSENMLESLILYARAGQGLIIAPCSLAMATSPSTLAGTLVQNNAEILAGIVLIQLINPGSPVLYGNTSSIADMRTVSIALGAPELSLLVGAANQLARFYKLPSRSGGALSDAKYPDFQAGMESMLSLLITVTSETSLVMQSAGILDSFLTLSPEKLLLDEEIGGMARRFRRGISVNQDTLAIAEIKAHGPGAHFLESDYTLSHFRQEFRNTQLSDRQTYNPERDYSRQLLEQAREAWQKRVEDYVRPPLPAGVEPELLEYYRKTFGHEPQLA